MLPIRTRSRNDQFGVIGEVGALFACMHKRQSWNQSTQGTPLRGIAPAGMSARTLPYSSEWMAGKHGFARQSCRLEVHAANREPLASPTCPTKPRSESPCQGRAALIGRTMAPTDESPWFEAWAPTLAPTIARPTYGHFRIENCRPYPAEGETRTLLGTVCENPPTRAAARMVRRSATRGKPALSRGSQSAGSIAKCVALDVPGLPMYVRGIVALRRFHARAKKILRR